MQTEARYTQPAIYEWINDSLKLTVVASNKDKYHCCVWVDRDSIQKAMDAMPPRLEKFPGMVFNNVTVVIEDTGEIFTATRIITHAGGDVQIFTRPKETGRL